MTPTPRQLAEAFVAVLREWLTPEQFDEVCRRNAVQTDRLVCHSHDFCDANMAMYAAFQSLLRLHAPRGHEAPARAGRTEGT
jgi:hypothetical protein